MEICTGPCLRGGSLRGWQTGGQVVAVRINYQQWTLLFAIVFLSRLPIALSQDQTRSPQSVEPGTVKHAGGKDDIQAIGSRTIGKRGFGNWYSPEQEIKMGREYSHAIENGAKFVDDPVITEYVNRIRASPDTQLRCDVPFTIKVIDCGDINAYALPGGFLYVNSGLILAADDEAELAGVMAHEIAHVAAHHRTRQITRSQLLNFASMPLIFFGVGWESPCCNWACRKFHEASRRRRIISESSIYIRRDTILRPISLSLNGSRSWRTGTWGS